MPLLVNELGRVNDEGAGRCLGTLHILYVENMCLSRHHPKRRHTATKNQDLAHIIIIIIRRLPSEAAQSAWYLPPYPTTAVSLRPSKRHIQGMSFCGYRLTTLLVRVGSQRLRLAHQISRQPIAGKGVATTTTRNFSKESSASDFHSKVSQTLQPPPPPELDPEAPIGVTQQIFGNPDRRSRFNQAVWYAAGAFMVMLTAAQSLKSGRERRAVSRELVVVEEQSAKRLALLQSLFQDDAMDKLVQSIRQAQSTNETPSSKWFATRGRSKDTPDDSDTAALKIALLKTMEELIGDEALDAAQRETLHIRLSQDTPTTAQGISLAPTAATATAKRVPFTM